MKKDQSTKGILFALNSGFLYSTFGIFARSIKNDFTPIFQTVSDSLPSAIFSFIFWLILTKKNERKISISNKKIWAVNLLSAGFISVFHYLSTTRLSLGLAMFLFYGSSLVVTYIFSKFVHKEEIDRKEKISLLLALGGLLLLNITLIKSFPIIFMLYPIIAGSFFGIKQNTSKIISKDNSPFIIATLSYLTMFTVLMPLLLIPGEKININFVSMAWGINLIYAFFATIAAVSTIFAFKFSEATKANLLLLSELIFIVLIGYFFYNENLSLLEIFGSILILAAQVLPHLRIPNAR